MKQENRQIISIADAALWNRHDTKEPLLSLGFKVPYEVSRPFSTYSDEGAAEEYSNTALSTISATRGFMPRAITEKSVTRLADDEPEAIRAKHASSGAQQIQEKIIAYLQSEGYPAIDAGYDGRIEKIVRVNMPVKDAPQKVLDLAHTLSKAELLQPHVSIKALQEATGVDKVRETPTHSEFLIAINSAAQGPSRGEAALSA